MIEARDNFWTLYFDGSSTSTSAGVGIVIQSPQRHRWYFSLKLDFECTNNQAEYEALVIGLGVLHELRAPRVFVLGDSELVINQLNGTFRCMSCTLAPYHMVASYLAESFDGITFSHVSRDRNTIADELAQLASGAQLLGGEVGRMTPTVHQSYLGLGQSTSPPSRPSNSNARDVFAIVIGTRRIVGCLYGRGITRRLEKTTYAIP